MSTPQETPRQRARRDHVSARDVRWSVQGPARMTAPTGGTYTEARRMPSQATLDRLADERLHAGYAGRRYATCPACWMRHLASVPHECA